MALIITEEQLQEQLRFVDVEGKKLFSVYDMMRIVLPDQSDNARHNMFKYYTDHKIVKPDAFLRRKFPGSNTPTPVCEFHVLLRLLTKLPGAIAEQFCQRGMMTLARAFAGDLSMAAQIQKANCLLAGTELQEALLEGTGVDGTDANYMHQLCVEKRQISNMIARQDSALKQIEIIASLDKLKQKIADPLLKRYLDNVVVPPPISAPPSIPLRKATAAQRARWINGFSMYSGRSLCDAG